LPGPTITSTGRIAVAAVDLLDPGQGGGGKDAAGHRAGGAVGWRAQHDLGHPRDPGREHRHQHRRDEGHGTAGHVDAGPVDRAAQLAHDQAVALVAGLVVELLAVVGEDVGPGRLQGLPQQRGQVGEGGLEVGRRHPQGLGPDAVEALGEVAHGLVTPLADLGEEGLHLGDRRLGGGVGPGDGRAVVGRARGAAQVESPEHEGSMLRAPMGNDRTGMDDPRPELSSVSTALDDLTKRLSAMADASAGGDENLAIELFEIERSLRGAQRRLSRLVSSRPSSAS
jgi:hypothetical protein